MKKKQAYFVIVLILSFCILISGCISGDEDKISGVRLINDETAKANYNSNVDKEKIMDEKYAENNQKENDILSKTNYTFNEGLLVGYAGPCKSSEIIMDSNLHLTSSAFNFKKTFVYYDCFEKMLFSFSIISVAQGDKNDFLKSYIADLKNDIFDVNLGATTDSNGIMYLSVSRNIKNGNMIDITEMWHDEYQVYLFTIYVNNVDFLTQAEKDSIEQYSGNILDLYKLTYPSKLNEPFSYFD